MYYPASWWPSHADHGKQHNECMKSSHPLSEPLILSRVTCVLGSIPAIVRWQTEFTPYRSPANRRGHIAKPFTLTITPLDNFDYHAHQTVSLHLIYVTVCFYYVQSCWVLFFLKSCMVYWGLELMNRISFFFQWGKLIWDKCFWFHSIDQTPKSKHC